MDRNDLEIIGTILDTCWVMARNKHNPNVPLAYFAIDPDEQVTNMMTPNIFDNHVKLYGYPKAEWEKEIYDGS